MPCLRSYGRKNGRNILQQQTTHSNSSQVHHVGISCGFGLPPHATIALGRQIKPYSVQSGRVS
uniref:Uncharacterized protein n=1 Tax=Rhizobium rhizogenes TaxID=359 RepID=A0A4P8DK27_RHIRH|nr:hypothetical protein pOC-C5.8_546 [Rhizobium rhizogenes]